MSPMIIILAYLQKYLLKRSSRLSKKWQILFRQFLIVISDTISLFKLIAFSKDLQMRHVLTYYISRQRFPFLSVMFEFHTDQ